MKKIFSILTLMLLCSSCEKVIKVGLNSADAKYVIEGTVTDQSSPCSVKISRTKDFDADNTFEGPGNAFVTISDNAGNSDTLVHTGNGLYLGSGLSGMPGRTYYLTVAIGSETFYATSAMPQAVQIDSLYIENNTDFGDTVKLFYIRYPDPAGIKNYYRYCMDLNNDRLKNITLGNDEFNDGKIVKRALTYSRRDNDDVEMNSGDSITIEMQGLNEAVYHYLFTLSQTLGQTSASPANPVSNISGGALGYFSAHTLDRKKIVVP